MRAHPRAVGVEGANDARVDALLAVVGHRQRLGVALGLVVDAARADRVDVAPIALGLRVDLRIAVDLGGRGEDEAGAVLLRQAEHVVGAVGADLERVQRQPQVVDRARRRGEVIDEVDRLVDEERLGEVVLDEEVAVVADVLDVLQRPRVEVVDADHAVTLAEKVVGHMRAEKAGAAADQAGAHRRADDRRQQGRVRPTGGLAPGMRPACEPATSRAAVDLLGRHGPMLLRIARRHSLCREDAEDALQRASEILLTKAPVARARPADRLDGGCHQARGDRGSPRAASACCAASPPRRPSSTRSTSSPPTPRSRRSASSARRGRRGAARARRRSRPTSGSRSCSRRRATRTPRSARCCGWTYTKVNRCLAEGRAKLRARRAAVS